MYHSFSNYREASQFCTENENARIVGVWRNYYTVFVPHQIQRNR